MGKGPKKSDYQPSEADRASAAISLQRYNDFKAKYQPLLLEMRDKARDAGRLTGTARRVAQADTAQALADKTPTMRAATTVDETTGNFGRALASQLEKATAGAVDASNEMGAGVLASANQQALTGQQGLAAIARMDTGSTLSEAAREQSERDSRLAAATQLGSAVLFQGAHNLSTGGRFFTPNPNTSIEADGSVTPLGKDQKVSLVERLRTGGWDRLANYGRVG